MGYVPRPFRARILPLRVAGNAYFLDVVLLSMVFGKIGRGLTPPLEQEFNEEALQPGRKVSVDAQVGQRALSVDVHRLFHPFSSIFIDFSAILIDFHRFQALNGA